MALTGKARAAVLAVLGRLGLIHEPEKIRRSAVGALIVVLA